MACARALVATGEPLSRLWLESRMDSPLAPAAYLLGVAMLVGFYGWGGLADWERRVMLHAGVVHAS